jgi:xanthine/uracil permease
MKGTSWFRDGISTAQWLIFLLANSLSLPIVVGQLYHLSSTEVAGLLQRTLLVAGLTSFLQGWAGHRYLLPDGPAGIWLGVFAISAAMTGEGSGHVTLRLLEGGMAVCGITLILLGLSGWLNRSASLFTPLVTGGYLMLLSLQLSGVFLKGMLGVNEGSAADPVSSAVALGVFALVLFLSIRGRGGWRNYAVLIGMTVGWLVWEWLGKSSTQAASVSLPVPLAWGMPIWDAGMILTGIMVALVLICNTVASMAAMKQVLGEESDKDVRRLARAGLMGGVANLTSAVFSTVGMVPLSVAAGFVGMTGEKRKQPFMAACLALAVLSFVSPAVSLFSRLPGPVAYAALLASFARMFGLGLQAVLSEPLDQRRLTILGIGMSFGMGTMFLPPTVFTALPSWLQPVLGNGLLVGMFLILVLERVWREQLGSASVSDSSAR